MNPDHELHKYLSSTTPPPELSRSRMVQIFYTNHRGETSDRVILPACIYWGSTEWHPTPQWLLSAWDVLRMGWRDFALAGLGARGLPWFPLSKTYVFPPEIEKDVMS